ncbi:MAG: 2-hydroxyacyl-CoA dehydratase family protein [Thermodesulfobacteriota bacterium]|nr:2-hydroxyacyl-CoA dehydratase family protein [Thermodesulfobacteriota bacterium]
MNDKNNIISSKVETYYQNYGLRAKELNDEGKKIIGYICSFVPLEIITAAGCVPFRLRGDVSEPITKGDTLLETIVCPYIRSCFDLAVKDKYNFLDGIVLPHACDSITRGYSTWMYSLDLPYSHFINIPSVVKEHSFAFFNGVLNTFRQTLEGFVGKEITDDDIAEAIKLHNENRIKAKALYEFRKSDPPMISGVELTKVLTVGSSLPVEEANALFDEVLEELKQREESPCKIGPRIMIDGACVDNIEIVKLIEDSGANVVIDSLCNGTRDSFPLADVGGDPIDAIAHRYLDKINCPKTYRENKEMDFKKDIEARFGDIGAFAGEYKADGLLLYVYKYCDPVGFEVPARKAYYDHINLPHLYLEDEYSAGTIGQLKTRIQAFLEMIV